MVLLRQKHEAPLSMKSPEPRAKGDVDIRGGNYSKGLNKQDVNLTDRLLADRESTHPDHIRYQGSIQRGQYPNTNHTATTTRNPRDVNRMDRKFLHQPQSTDITSRLSIGDSNDRRSRVAARVTTLTKSIQLLQCQPGRSPNQ